MYWFANWWTSHAAVPSIAHDPYLSEGLTAYAAKQADLRLTLRNNFEILWKDVQSWLDENNSTVPAMESTFEYDYNDD